MKAIQEKSDKKSLSEHFPRSQSVQLDQVLIEAGIQLTTEKLIENASATKKVDRADLSYKKPSKFSPSLTIKEEPYKPKKNLQNLEKLEESAFKKVKDQVTKDLERINSSFFDNFQKLSNPKPESGRRFTLFAGNSPQKEILKNLGEIEKILKSPQKITSEHIFEIQAICKKASNLKKEVIKSRDKDPIFKASLSSVSFSLEGIDVKIEKIQAKEKSSIKSASARL
jgi:hypothetical protein